jgi:hypothetical protein
VTNAIYHHLHMIFSTICHYRCHRITEVTATVAKIKKTNKNNQQTKLVSVTIKRIIWRKRNRTFQYSSSLTTCSSAAKQVAAMIDNKSNTTFIVVVYMLLSLFYTVPVFLYMFPKVIVALCWK